MNHLVYLDAQAGELEKILSGVKTMLVKEFDPTQPPTHPVNQGDGLYFLKSADESALRVKATVTRVLFFTNTRDEELSQILKEMQPKLHLTEEQYNYWSAQQQVLLVEFGSAQKIAAVHVALNKVAARSGWIAFDEFSLIT